MWRVSLRAVARCWLWSLIPLTLALEVPTYLEQRRALTGDWPSAVEVANGSLPVLAILAAVGTAATSVSWQRHRPVAMGSTVRARAWALLPAGIALVLTAGTHLCWVAGVLVLAAVDTSGSPTLGPVVSGVALLLAASGVGALVASVVRSWLAAPLVGALLYALLVVASSGRFNNFATFGGVGESITGMQPRSAVVWTQLPFLVLVGVATVVGALAALERSALLTAVATSPALAGVVAGVGLYGLGPDRFEAREVDWSCVGSAPTYCEPAVEADGIEEEQARLSTAFDRWRRATGQEVPERVWRRLPFPVPDHEVEIASFDGVSRNLGFALVEALYPCSASWSERQWDAAESVAWYLSRDEGAPGPDVVEAFRRVAC